MKKFIFAIAIMLIASTANAGILLTIPNKAGGTIRFTDEKCVSRGNNQVGWLAVRSVSDEGDVLFGCWTKEKDSGEMFVIYQDGSVRIYDIGEVSTTDYFEKHREDKDNGHKTDERH